MEKKINRIDTHFQGPDAVDAWIAFVPASAIMVTTIDKKGNPNIIPLTGWGILCRYPFIVGIAICQGQYTKNYFPRYSHKLLKEIPEFVLNIPHSGLKDAITITGSSSGDKVNKFKEAHLTPEPSIVIRPPAIAECPVNMECKVIRVVEGIGSHDIFLGEVVAVHAAVYNETIDEDVMTLNFTDEHGKQDHMLWRSLPVWNPSEGK
jgi:flavin reductase (DIM6/NTAB) family NADH-FMN oxidoreductase RutF